MDYGPAAAVTLFDAGGVADLEAQRPATRDSRYRIGSVSKPITTLALGRMLEEGQLSLDQDFRDLVPSFPAKQWPFTLRQLARLVEPGTPVEVIP